MATIKLLLALICFAFIGSNQLYRSHPLKGHALGSADDQKRRILIKIAENEIGVRELTNHNDGKRVEMYLAAVNLKKGDPYCAAFISWVFARAGYAKPSSGWCPDLFPPSRLARSALPGDVLGIYFEERQRIAHVGLVVEQHGSYLTSIEANTNISGSREGSGVYKKIRHIRTIKSFADWVVERRKFNEKT